MKLNLLLAAGAVTALTAGAAVAQSAYGGYGSGDYGPGYNGGYGDRAMPSAMSAEQAGVPSAYSDDPNTVLESSPTPAAAAYRLRAGDPDVVTNGPVPDTPANRRLFGAPMSHAGRMTAPAGN